MGWIEIEKCDLCRTDDFDIIFELPYIDLQGTNAEKYVQKIAYCPHCKSIFTQNPLDEEALENRYKNESKFEFDSDEYILQESEEYKKRCARQKFFINQYIGDKYSSIFEIGAASGYNLSLYSDKQTYGIEPSAVNCKNAKRNYGVELYNGTYQDYLKIGGGKHKYDLFFLSNTLEHIVNPASFLKKFLTDNTQYVFLEVPTFDYKFVDEPFGMFCEEHVNYFTFESLNCIMNKLGYSAIALELVHEFNCTLPAGTPSMMTLWVRKSDVNKLQVSNNARENIIEYIGNSQTELKRIDSIIDAISTDKRVAVWGVGHHASMLAANTKLKTKNIVRVYDSDNRKNKYTFCGRRIQVFDEKDVFEHKIDVIIVATYTAQKAISKVLYRYENEVEVVYLYPHLID